MTRTSTVLSSPGIRHSPSLVLHRFATTCFPFLHFFARSASLPSFTSSSLPSDGE